MKKGSLLHWDFSTGLRKHEQVEELYILQSEGKEKGKRAYWWEGCWTLLFTFNILLTSLECEWAENTARWL